LPERDLAEVSEVLARKAEGDAKAVRLFATHGSGELPVDVDAVIALTQYAAPLRYEDLLDAEPLDRDATVALVGEIGQWAETQIAEPTEDTQGDEEEDKSGPISCRRCCRRASSAGRRRRRSRARSTRTPRPRHWNTPTP
jgi:hypothetical protein